MGTLSRRWPQLLLPHHLRRAMSCLMDKSSLLVTRGLGAQRLFSSPHFWVWSHAVSMRPHTTPSRSVMSISGRICMPTLCCLVAPPCTLALLTVCRRKSCPCSFSNEDQDHCPTREEVLCMDWRIHPGFTLHLPTDVDQQTGIRRIRPINCPQKVLLKSRALSFCATFVHSKLTKS